MRIQCEFIGEDLVAADIVGFGERADDLRPAFRDVLGTLRRAASRQFDSAGAYGSGGWAPLAPSTVAEKAAKGLDPRIMHRSYALRDSLAVRGARGAWGRVTKKTLSYGTTVDYARYHQAGTSRMPQRRLLELPAGDRKLIVRTIYRRIMAENGRVPA